MLHGTAVTQPIHQGEGERGMATSISSALDRSRAMLPQMIAWRRHIHQHPELAMEEYQTSELVAQVLTGLGLEVLRGPEHTGTPTGVVGILRGEAAPPGGGRTIAIRADMDALPITERTGLPFASRHEGKMHACGHDGHTAILLGTASILAEQRRLLPGNVKFIFQPAEETIGGAEPMVKAGVVDDVDVVLALHLNASQPTGFISLKYGVATAAVDTAHITILGKNSHGAWPHRGIDAIHTAGQAIVALQAMVSRQTSALDPLVFTIGTIRGGTASNIVAEEVAMDATIRTLRDETRAAVPQRIEQILRGVCRAFGAEYRLQITPGYPSVINDPLVCALVEEAASAVLGPDRVLLRDEPGMGAEDFAYFGRAVRGCMFNLGARNEEQGITALAHTPYFTFDEEAMAYGAAIFVQAVQQFLAAGLPPEAPKGRLPQA